MDVIIPRDHNKYRDKIHEDEEPDASATHIRKRTIKIDTHSPLKRRRLIGKLAAAMNSLPVELFEEILCHLGPFDLLRLSRTCKILRKHLIDESSMWIWNIAAENINMPECPPDFNLPQLTSFLFDTFCTHCLESRALKQNFSLRVRLCKKCNAEQVAPVAIVMKRLLPDFCSLPDKVQDCILKLLLTTGGRLVRFLGGPVNLDSMRSVKCYSPSVEMVLKKYYDPKLSPEENHTLATERHDIVKMIHDDASELEDWFDSERSNNQCKRFVIMGNRRIQILDKLKALGYDEADLSPRGDEKTWKWAKLINQPRELTDRIWDRILPQLKETIRLRNEKYMKAAVDRKEYIVNTWNNSYECGRNPFISTQDLLQIQETKDSLETKSYASIILAIDRLRIFSKAASLSQQRFERLEKDYDECRPRLCMYDFEQPKRCYIYKKIHNSLRVNYTFEFLDVLNEKFVCLRCSPLLRKSLKWSELIAHYLQEQIEWVFRNSLVSSLSELEEPTLVNNNDHDLDAEEPLVDFFIPSYGTPSDDDFLSTCGCREAGETCKSIRCGICFVVDNSTIPFKCVRLLRAHIHAKHLPKTWSHEPVDIALCPE